MPKPIAITPEWKRNALEDFTKMLKGVKISDGKLKYNKSFSYKTDNAKVWLTMDAYKKIIALVTGFDSEVAWHGTVSRISDGEFLIDDVLVYPQVATGTTVNTDQAKYTDWLYAHDDEIFNKLKMQGHSHCKMGVTPSGVDEKHRQQIVSQLKGDMFYIFMIWNKSLNTHTLIYDMKRNMFFDNDEIDIKIRSDEGMGVFLAETAAMVQSNGRG